MSDLAKADGTKRQQMTVAASQSAAAQQTAKQAPRDVSMNLSDSEDDDDDDDDGDESS
jgi:hypothetical protein